MASKHKAARTKPDEHVRRAAECVLGGDAPTLADDVDTAIRFYPVSTRVNKPSYDAPDCIEALA